jgi:hypothetical protein
MELALWILKFCKRLEGADLPLEFGVLALEVLLLRFDLCQVSSNVFDNAALLCYGLLQARDELGEIVQVRTPFFTSGRGRRWRFILGRSCRGCSCS